MEELKLEKFSYSKLSTFEGCPYKYKIIYVDGHFINEGSIAAEFGTLVHSTEESIAKCIKQKEPIDYEALTNNFKQKIGELRAKFPNEYYEKNKQGWDYDDKASIYLTSGLHRLEDHMKAHPEYEIVGIEQHFNLVFKDKIIIHGFIDRVIHNTKTDEYIVEDIKTYSKEVSKGDLVTPLQFVFYSIAAQQLYNTTKDKLTFNYDIPLCNIRQQAGTKGFEDRGSEKILKLLNQIENKEFKPKPSPLCHWCCFCQTYPNQPKEAAYLCPYYSNWTRETKDFSVNMEWMGYDYDKRLVEEYQKRAKNPKPVKNESKKVDLFETNKTRNILRVRK